MWYWNGVNQNAYGISITKHIYWLPNERKGFVQGEIRYFQENHSKSERHHFNSYLSNKSGWRVNRKVSSASSPTYSGESFILQKLERVTLQFSNSFVTTFWMWLSHNLAWIDLPDINLAKCFSFIELQFPHFKISAVVLLL